MLLVSNGWFHCATPEEARSVMERVSALHADDGILLVDLTCADFADRFILQNVNSRRYVGAISRKDGGYHSRILETKDCWKVFIAFITAFRRQGVEVHIQVNLICIGNVMVPFNAFISSDPATRLFIVRLSAVELNSNGAGH